MVEASFFIPLLIVAVTQVLKMVWPTIQGGATIIVALSVGVLVALLDTLIGVPDISVAQGLVYALEAVGVTVLAAKAGGGARGDA